MLFRSELNSIEDGWPAALKGYIDAIIRHCDASDLNPYVINCLIRKNPSLPGFWSGST